MARDRTPDSTQVAQPPDRFTRPGDAARHLYDAWHAGNRSDAVKSASPEAVDYLFAHSIPRDPLTPSECELLPEAYGCHWAGERSRLMMFVEGGASAGYRVAWTYLDRPTVLSNDGVPQVIASPERSRVGGRVRIDGFGFSDETYRAPSADLFLVGGPEGCLLYARAEHSVSALPDGYLSGEFVVPEGGDCMMGGGYAAVTPGHFYIGFGTPTSIIGQLDVAA